ncbi:hypothetical protein Kfla_2183 [Kribbella flavida DSM 17836]|uniref:Uncharacterized protein n=1 Tax=Kribbella flavida (strain DSM 17836 / JCM 10339 / NBRC 14399) TaxID=479435 RepID=D2PSD8_KRIFD|nr:hypothetical protein [Kribbella flavida]ADB31262.1 hypothetical protein Kfla_2183 [Kribbella flavida DSM 17836]
MTADKRLKRAAREFSAHAGIAYVSARRQVLELATREGLPYHVAAGLLIEATDAPPASATRKAVDHSANDAAARRDEGEVQ